MRAGILYVQNLISAKRWEGQVKLNTALTDPAKIKIQIGSNITNPLLCLFIKAKARAAGI